MTLSLGLGLGLTRTAGGVAFVGPFDAMTPAKNAYGFNRFYAAYNGPLVRLRRASDNAESDFSAMPDGELDLDAIDTWRGAGVVTRIVTIYDQAGSINMTAPAAANQPFYADSIGGFGINGYPAGYWSNADDSVLNPSAQIPVDTLETMGVSLALPTGSGRILSIRNALTGVDDYNTPSRIVFFGETYPSTRKLGSYYNSANLAISPVVNMDNDAFVWRCGKLPTGLSYNKDGDVQVYQGMDLSAIITPSYMTWGNSRPGVGAGTEGNNPVLFIWYANSLPTLADFVFLRAWSAARFGTPA